MLPGPASGPAAAQSRPSNVPQANQGGRAGPSMPNARPPQTPNQGAPQRPGQPTAGLAQGHGRGQPVPQARIPSQNSPNHGAGGASAGGEAVAFFSAKAVNQLPESSFQGDVNTQLSAPRAQQLFNPKAESPSIRKTPGIDHSSSKPLARNGQHVAPPSSQSQSITGNSGFAPPRPAAGNGPGSGARVNAINPNLDQTRRIGAPGGLGSPLGNRGSFRQPTMKRPPPGDANGARAALADLPANPTAKVEVGGPDGSDAKRQKMT
jgi:DNA repair and recombination protein RAD52